MDFLDLNENSEFSQISFDNINNKDNTSNTYFDDINTVDFTNYSDNAINHKNRKKQSIGYYDKNGNKIEYDIDTIEKYRVLRKTKIDPISMCEVDEEYSFKFEYQWDPITGERSKDKDPYGPLYFDPLILAKYYYHNRLRGLWIEEQDEGEDGYVWSGYYGDGVGIGEDFNIKGRGSHPEWYLFRLPITDCYLKKDQDKQIITFGPKLTDKEIKYIDDILRKRKKLYKSIYGKYPPSLVDMKNHYEFAINPTPPVLNRNLSDSELELERAKINRKAVDNLKNMIG